MIYAVIPLRQTHDIGSIITSIDPLAYTRYGPNIYLVSFEGTTAELSQAIGFGVKDKDVGPGIVLKISYYHGNAYPDVWEWIQTRQNE